MSPDLGRHRTFRQRVARRVAPRVGQAHPAPSHIARPHPSNKLHP